MQLSHADLRELADCADRWLSTSEAERDALRAQAASRSGAFAEAFAAMVEQLTSEKDHGVLTPIPAAMRDAALAASNERAGAEADMHSQRELGDADPDADVRTLFGQTLTPPSARRAK